MIKNTAKIVFSEEKSDYLANEGEKNNKTDASGIIDLDGVKWAKRALKKGSVGKAPQKVSDVLNSGDLILGSK